MLLQNRERFDRMPALSGIPEGLSLQEIENGRLNVASGRYRGSVTLS
jgi:hypothetical protein